MDKKDKEQLWFEEFEREKKKILDIGVFRKGSITKRWQACGNPKCKCKTDKKYYHGPYYWWTTKEKGKTKAILVPQEMLDDAYEYIEQSRQLKNKIKILSRLSDKIIRNRIKTFRENYKKTKK